MNHSNGFRTFCLVVVCLFGAGVHPTYADPIVVQEEMNKFGTVNQSDVKVPPNNTGDNSCAPTATMNSFTFLTNMYGEVYGNSLIGGQANWTEAAKLLAGPAYMKTSSETGTTEGNWVSGKVGYLENFAPGMTIYNGMDSDDTDNRPEWDKNANPTIDFLVNELSAGADVEIGIDGGDGLGHVLTLTGVVWDDRNGDKKFDAGDTLTLNTIDPANPTVNTPLTLSPALTDGGPMTISSGAYSNYVLTGALAESPVPEPSTFGLVGFGVISFAVGAYRRRRMPPV